MSTKEKDENKAKGGRARAKALSPTERSDIARKAAAARWDSDAPRVICEGPLQVGEKEINAAVLPDETRVLTQATFLRAIGRARSPKAGTGVLSTAEGLPFFLQAKALTPFITDGLKEAAQPIFWVGDDGRKQVGYRADLLPKVCEVYLRLRDHSLAETGKVPKQHEHIIQACDILMRGLAHVGIIALVDEATGYQDLRARNALEKILDEFISGELRKWAKTFPDEFYKEMFRLKGWDYKPWSVKRPGVVGRYTEDLVYRRLAPGVLDELKQKNPPSNNGRRKHKHFQWLTADVGDPRLREHLASVITLMKIHDDWDHFLLSMDRALPKFGDSGQLF